MADLLVGMGAGGGVSDLLAVVGVAGPPCAPSETRVSVRPAAGRLARATVAGVLEVVESLGMFRTVGGGGRKRTRKKMGVTNVRLVFAPRTHDGRTRSPLSTLK